jgi:hypothetical protein
MTGKKHRRDTRGAEVVGNIFARRICRDKIKFIREFLLVCIVLSGGGTLYSQNKIFSVDFGFGTVGGGINYSNGNKLQGEFDFNLLNFYMENNPTGLGIQIIPAEYKYSNIFDGHFVGFFNPTVYWNVFGILFKEKEYGLDYTIFGPFVNINWFNIINFGKVAFDETVFEAGIRFRLKIPLMDIFCVESGYRYFNNRHNYFIRITIDNLLPVALLAETMGF